MLADIFLDQTQDLLLVLVQLSDLKSVTLLKLIHSFLDSFVDGLVKVPMATMIGSLILVVQYFILMLKLLLDSQETGIHLLAKILDRLVRVS